MEVLGSADDEREDGRRERGQPGQHHSQRSIRAQGNERVFLRVEDAINEAHGVVSFGVVLGIRFAYSQYVSEAVNGNSSSH